MFGLLDGLRPEPEFLGAPFLQPPLAARTPLQRTAIIVGRDRSTAPTRSVEFLLATFFEVLKLSSEEQSGEFGFDGGMMQVCRLHQLKLLPFACDFGCRAAPYESGMFGLLAHGSNVKLLLLSQVK